MSAFVLALVLAGFARTFFLRPFSDAMDKVTGRELPDHLVVHAVVMAAWFALFVAQMLGVRAGRVDLHRKLGVAAVAIAAAVVLTGVWTVLQAIPRMVSTGETLAQIRPAVFGNAAQLTIFSVLVTVGVVKRRQPAIHKRVMMLASIAIVAPATTRIGELLGLPELALGLPTLLGLPLSVAVYDRWSLGRVHPATKWSLALIGVSTASMAAFGRSEVAGAIIDALARRGAGG
jgi:uncharacterized membrane protein YozB (DUF420 family)